MSFFRGVTEVEHGCEREVGAEAASRNSEVKWDLHVFASLLHCYDETSRKECGHVCDERCWKPMWEWLQRTPPDQERDTGPDVLAKGEDRCEAPQAACVLILDQEDCVHDLGETYGGRGEQIRTLSDWHL